MDLMVSSASNFPIISASLRLVVIRTEVRSVRCTNSGTRRPRFTFTTNLMFFVISPVREGLEEGGSRNKVLLLVPPLAVICLCSVNVRPSSATFSSAIKCLCKARKEVPAAWALWRKAHIESHSAKTRRKADREPLAPAVCCHRSRALLPRKSDAVRESCWRRWRMDRTWVVLGRPSRRGHHRTLCRQNG